MESNGDQGAPVSVDHRKLFVGGLSQETSEENVREYFTKYGAIESINLKTDSNTGNSRGFAFIVFTNGDSLDAILAEEHSINNKQVDVQKAKTKQGKLFVGGISQEMSEDDIKNHFAQFGNIVQAEFPFDKMKNERKKFCFIIFDTEQTVKDIVKTRKQVINNVEVDVKKAVTKDDRFGFNNFSRGSSRGRGGGRGGYQSFNNYQSYSSNYNSGYGGGGGGGWEQQSYGNEGYSQGGYSSNGGGYGGYGGFQGRQRGGNRGRGARQQPY